MIFPFWQKTFVKKKLVAAFSTKTSRGFKPIVIIACDHFIQLT